MSLSVKAKHSLENQSLKPQWRWADKTRQLISPSCSLCCH